LLILLEREGNKGEEGKMKKKKRKTTTMRKMMIRKKVRGQRRYENRHVHYCKETVCRVS